MRELYQEYVDDRIISFYYFLKNPDDEKEKEEIIKKFAAKHKNG